MKDNCQASIEDQLRALGSESAPRTKLWARLATAVNVRTMAEIGVYRGEFAATILQSCPDIQRYYMIDPWKHQSKWNKPANLNDDEFDQCYEQALAATEFAASRRRILRGTTAEVIDAIPDGELDLAYIDGDHTLRGITIDLIRVYQKVREGGLIGGDDFCTSIWQHPDSYEPTLVFPLAVYFAEAIGAPIYALPSEQFVIIKLESGFDFVDLTGKYRHTEILKQLNSRPGGWKQALSRLAQKLRR